MNCILALGLFAWICKKDICWNLYVMFLTSFMYLFWIRRMSLLCQDLYPDPKSWNQVTSVPLHTPHPSFNSIIQGAYWIICRLWDAILEVALMLGCGYPKTLYIRNIVQSLSCVQLCDPMDCSMPGSPVLHYLLEIAQIHVHWVSDAI